jgi:hypothetical protein
MEDFINEYYSIERFRNAYKRLIEPLSDKKQWSKVDISSFISAPLHKRDVDRQKKNRFKALLEGGGDSKTYSAKGNESKKDKKVHRGHVKCPNCGELGHRQSSYKCLFNGTKKRQEIIILFIYCLLLF